jgi:hypothetical protein
MVVNYGCKIKAKKKNKLQAVEMDCLRHGARKAKSERVLGKEIRTQMTLNFMQTVCFSEM